MPLADLASRADLDAGVLRIIPARRLVEGPNGVATLEPIVMRVFLLLLDAGGAVVTRETLFDQAWGGVFVGDDSLNRAIGRIRKAAAEIAPGAFEIETIPRTGYRLTGPILDDAPARREPTPPAPSGMPRRTIVAAGATALAGVGLGGWLLNRRADAKHFDRLVKLGRERMEYGDGSDAPIAPLRDAVALRPDDPVALGLLAYTLVANADDVNRGRGSFAAGEVLQMANRSLRADPNNAAARLAKMQLQRSTLDLAQTETELRAILAASPDDLFATQDLWDLLQTTGQSRHALALVEHSVSLFPLTATNQYPLAQLLWINGRVPEADRVIERALTIWPDHRYVRFARFTILAFTGRPAAARAMLQNPATRPQIYSPPAIALWQPSLTALETPSPANVATVRQACRAAIDQRPQLAYQAVMTLSALGDVDTAFEIANKLLLFRSGPPGAPSRSTAWRFTPWLFTPPVAAMRADPRFVELCDGVGLTDYWRARSVKPDYPIGHA